MQGEGRKSRSRRVEERQRKRRRWTNTSSGIGFTGPEGVLEKGVEDSSDTEGGLDDVGSELSDGVLGGFEGDGEVGGEELVHGSVDGDGGGAIGASERERERGQSRMLVKSRRGGEEQQSTRQKRRRTHALGPSSFSFKSFNSSSESSSTNLVTTPASLLSATPTTFLSQAGVNLVTTMGSARVC